MQYLVAACVIDKTRTLPAAQWAPWVRGPPNLQNNKILCGFFCWTPVMRSESNFSINYNYNYRGPEYQVAVLPVAMYAGYTSRS